MAIRIEETFTLRAPVDRVFGFIVDPGQVVHCLPGAELTGQADARTYTGRIKVKVGPVTAGYGGQARLVVVDAAEHRVQLVGEGRESGGPGSAKLTMTTVMRALGPSETEVHVEAELDVVGKIVSFGRGMIENVNAQMFRQFVQCLRSRLEQPEPAEAPGATPAPAAESSVGRPIGGERAAEALAPAPPPPIRILPVVLRAVVQSLVRLIRRRPATGASDRPR